MNSVNGTVQLQLQLHLLLQEAPIVTDSTDGLMTQSPIPAPRDVLRNVPSNVPRNVDLL